MNFSNDLFDDPEFPSRTTQPKDRSYRFVDDSAESILAMIFSNMGIPSDDVPRVMVSLKQLGSSGISVDRLVAEATDFKKIQSQIRPANDVSLIDILTADKRQVLSTMSFIVNACASSGGEFAYMGTEFVCVPQSKEVETRVKNIVEENIEEFKTANEAEENKDDVFDAMASISPSIQLIETPTEWNDELYEEQGIRKALEGDFSRLLAPSLPATGKKYYKTAHPAIRSWPKGKIGNTIAGVAVLNELVPDSLIIVGHPRSGLSNSSHQVRPVSSEFYPSNYIVTSGSVTPTPSFASINPLFDYEKFEQEKFSRLEEFGDDSNAQLLLEQWSNDYCQGFIDDLNVDFSFLENDPVRDPVTPVDLGMFRFVVRLYDTKSSDHKTIDKYPTYVHLAGLNEATTARKKNAALFIQQFSPTGMCLIFPTVLASHCFRENMIEEEGLFNYDPDKITRSFTFPAATSKGLSWYFDSMRAVTMCALMSRGYLDWKDAPTLAAGVRHFRIAKSTNSEQASYLKSLCQITFCHGFTSLRAVQLHRTGKKNYARMMAALGGTVSGKAIGFSLTDFDVNPPPDDPSSEDSASSIISDGDSDDEDVPYNKEILTEFEFPVDQGDDDDDGDEY